MAEKPLKGLRPKACRRARSTQREALAESTPRPREFWTELLRGRWAHHTTVMPTCPGIRPSSDRIREGWWPAFAPPSGFAAQSDKPAMTLRACLLLDGCEGWRTAARWSVRAPALCLAAMRCHGCRRVARAFSIFRSRGLRMVRALLTGRFSLVAAVSCRRPYRSSGGRFAPRSGPGQGIVGSARRCILAVHGVARLARARDTYNS